MKNKMYDVFFSVILASDTDYKPGYNMDDGLMMISDACDADMKNHRFIPAPVIVPTMQHVLVQGDDEQADVNVDMNEEDGPGAQLMINQVFSRFFKSFKFLFSSFGETNNKSCFLSYLIKSYYRRAITIPLQC